MSARQFPSNIIVSQVVSKQYNCQPDSFEEIELSARQLPSNINVSQVVAKQYKCQLGCCPAIKLSARQFPNNIVVSQVISKQQNYQPGSFQAIRCPARQFASNRMGFFFFQIFIIHLSPTPQVSNTAGLNCATQLSKPVLNTSNIHYYRFSYKNINFSNFCSCVVIFTYFEFYI